MRKVKMGGTSKTNAATRTTATNTVARQSGFKWSDLVGQEITKVLSVDGDHLKLSLSNGTTFYVQGQGPVAFTFVTEVKTRSDFYHEMPNYLDSEAASNLECLQTIVPPGYTPSQAVAGFSEVQQLVGAGKTISLLQIPFKTRKLSGVSQTKEGSPNVGSAETTAATQ